MLQLARVDKEEEGFLIRDSNFLAAWSPALEMGGVQLCFLFPILDGGAKTHHSRCQTWSDIVSLLVLNSPSFDTDKVFLAAPQISLRVFVMLSSSEVNSGSSA